MGRNNAHALNSIRMLCRMQQVDEKVLYERSKLILSIYRDVCWSTVGRADEVHDELICYCGSNLDIHTPMKTATNVRSGKPSTLMPRRRKGSCRLNTSRSREPSFLRLLRL